MERKPDIKKLLGIGFFVYPLRNFAGIWMSTLAGVQGIKEIAVYDNEKIAIALFTITALTLVLIASDSIEQGRKVLN